MAVEPQNQTFSLGQSHPAELDIIARPFVVPNTADTDFLGLSAHLTEEQSGLLRSLLRQNVPLPTVVVIMEGMLGGQEHLDGGEDFRRQIKHSDRHVTVSGPPDYSSAEW